MGLLTRIKLAVGLKVHPCQLPNCMRTVFSLSAPPKNWNKNHPKYGDNKGFFTHGTLRNWAIYIGEKTGVKSNEAYNIIAGFKKLYGICIDEGGELEPSMIYVPIKNEYPAKKCLDDFFKDVNSALHRKTGMKINLGYDTN